MAILRLKELMKEKGISREELAGRTGVSMTTISNISSEKNYPTFPLLVQIAKALDVDVREMLVPTKEQEITIEKINEAKMLIERGLSILKLNGETPLLIDED